MAEYFNKNGIINTLLLILNVGLEILLGAIALGLLIGLYEFLK